MDLSSETHPIRIGSKVMFFSDKSVELDTKSWNKALQKDPKKILIDSASNDSDEKTCEGAKKSMEYINW